MRSLMPFAAVGLLAGLLLVLPPADPARGCAVVPPAGRQVDITSESAIIVWDEAARTEHFIRQARFTTTAADFGFLVPSPTEPELAEAGDAMFQSLDARTAPRVVHETRTDNRFGVGDGPFGCFMAAKTDFATVEAASPAPNSSVTVLKEQRVGQFDAAVLKADDPQKLREWLEKNGYQSRPQLVEWLKKYTDDKWIITAFKIAGHGEKGNDSGTQLPVDATAVRMTFRAEKPFYPYREPTDVRDALAGNRFLRVFFLADKRYAGTLGTTGVWPGRAVWANAAVPPSDAIGPAAKPDRTWWLTEFEDRSSPRPGTDEVYFAPAADQATLERPPIIRTTVTVAYWPGWGGVAALLPIALIVVIYSLWRFAGRRPAA